MKLFFVKRIIYIQKDIFYIHTNMIGIKGKFFKIQKFDNLLILLYNTQTSFWHWECGVAWFNTLPCQGRDRGFKSRRSRQKLK